MVHQQSWMDAGSLWPHTLFLDMLRSCLGLDLQASMGRISCPCSGRGSGTEKGQEIGRGQDLYRDPRENPCLQTQ